VIEPGYLTILSGILTKEQAMHKWLTIVGARPNFIKLAALHRAFGKVDSVEHYIVHTGQHYDYEMNELFFQQLEIPLPDCHLGIGSGSRSDQIGRTLLALEPILQKQRPQWVVVVGDVNATVAGAIAARNLNLKLAHVEAGMRSFDWRMPEEINRIITDRLSDLLLVSEPAGVDNLLREGVEAERVHDTAMS
jgi:UDP-N-acetylglucosamine 2-epimerase (non-hydrolysing)